jgi:hypothetical protein
VRDVAGLERVLAASAGPAARVDPAVGAEDDVAEGEDRQAAAAAAAAGALLVRRRIERGRRERRGVDRVAAAPPPGSGPRTGELALDQQSCRLV